MSQEKQFHEKLILLNDEFVHYLERMRKATPHADFSPSINSYLKHIAVLDNLYGQTENGPTSNSPTGTTTQTIKSNGPTSISNFFSGLAPANSFGVTSQPSGGFTSQNNGDGDKEEDNEEQEEPPKPEEVEQTEKDAILSYKCVLHCLIKGTYEKRGVSYLSLKNLDSKKQLIIRDATAIGRLWTNTLVNDSLKWSKVDDKKIRISYPRLIESTTKKDENRDVESTKEERTEIETILVRLGAADELSKLVEELEKK